MYLANILPDIFCSGIATLYIFHNITVFIRLITISEDLLLPLGLSYTFCYWSFLVVISVELPDYGAIFLC